MSCACKVSLLVLLWHLPRLSGRCMPRDLKRIRQGQRYETFFSIPWVPEVFLLVCDVR